MLLGTAFTPILPLLSSSRRPTLLTYDAFRAASAFLGKQVTETLSTVWLVIFSSELRSKELGIAIEASETLFVPVIIAETQSITSDGLGQGGDN